MHIHHAVLQWTLFFPIIADSFDPHTFFETAPNFLILNGKHTNYLISLKTVPKTL